MADGVARAQALLQAGLGPSARSVAVQGIDGGDAVAVEARGQLRTMIPWVADVTLPLQARAVVTREKFRVGPGG